MCPRPLIARTGLLRAVAVIWLSLAAASGALANCSALPVLSSIVYEVEDLKRLHDTASVARAGHRINDQRQKISKFGMFETLKPLGYERKLDDILRLKVKLGALSQLAITQGPEKVKPFLNGSGFQRSYRVAKDLTDEFCDPRNAADQSEFASKVYRVWGVDFGSHQSGFAAPALALGMFFGVIGLLIGIYAGVRFQTVRRKRETRRSRRFACNIPVLLGAVNNIDTQTVVDLSLTGANVENPLNLPAGTCVNIQFGNISRIATVTWSNSRFASVQFETALSQKEMQATLKLSRPFEAVQNEKRDTFTGVAQI
ncbi:PilZ domain-containing protein [uncultured Litoreibacter sp.]|uniref:PilZ domain-containing protein n=1 Tax=uncultured Litoreibacter sp. TaxID=1392394 RepID=UPI00260A945F|nr:PilZ domain-containing protein [uncultured Litoreibacter sp.]